MIPVEALEDIDLAIVKEGGVTLEVPASTVDSPAKAPRRGPARADAPVFYNPAMELARDVSVAVLRASVGQRWQALDGLAGTGVRGIRYAVEVPDLEGVTLNDASPVAAALCLHNLELNGVATGRVTRRRLEALLAEERFDVVDIDPFGSPSRFLSGAVRSVRRHGLLAVTATDTPALCGTKSRPCLRRYGARPWRGDAMHEVALRILAGAMVREGARIDRAATPVLSMAEDHYVRIFARLDDGARRADAILGLMGYAWEDQEGGVATGNVPPSEGRWAGPMWLGPLHDDRLLHDMASDAHEGYSRRMGRLIELWMEEADLPPLLLDVNRLSSKAGVSSPRISLVIEGLRDRGFAAGRAHTNPVGIKTDAPASKVEEVILEVSRGA